PKPQNPKTPKPLRSSPEELALQRERFNSYNIEIANLRDEYNNILCKTHNRPCCTATRLFYIKISLNFSTAA
ncbi:MAG: hypothetical protein P4L69_19135, partial [Desulfosporosinus sp.]|nr:hypothetical protein [Desulfosporosinus sp.]